jgi:drug/metabolite transporter (DMT)-like permease
VGDLLVLAAMFSFACGAVALQRLGRHNGMLAINSFFYAVGSLGLVLHSALLVETPMQQLAALGGYSWLVIVFSGVVATALGAVAWGKGIAVLGMAGAGVYMSWVPVLGVAMAALLLDEQLTQWHLVGMASVFVGTIVSFSPTRKMASSRL